MEHSGRLVGGDEDQLEESAVAGGTDGDDPTLAAVVLLSNGENVAPGMEDVGVRDAVLTSADGGDLHSVKDILTTCLVKRNLTASRPHCTALHCRLHRSLGAPQGGSSVYWSPVTAAKRDAAGVPKGRLMTTLGASPP